MKILTLLTFAAALALPASAPAQPAGQVIQVWNFGFAPKPIQLAAGRPVTLTVSNQSGSGHDFTAPEFFAAARIIAGAAPDGRIDLPKHATVTITLIPAAGSYPVHCSHFMHQTMGMSDTILVR